MGACAHGTCGGCKPSEGYAHRCTGFDRRVVGRLFQWDFQILLLGKNAPNKCCEERKVVARRFLREENLSSTPRKIKTLFNRVQAVFVALARAWDGDSQSTEGLNSRVRQRTQKAPNQGLDTLNADIGTSSMVQLGTKDAPQGWSALKLKLQALCHMAEQGFEDKALMARVRSGPLPLPLGVASDSEATVVAEVGPGSRQSRWETPPPSYEFPKVVMLENRPQQFVDKWAAECSLRWFRAFPPKEALKSILAAFTVRPDLFSLSAVLAMEEHSEEHQQELGDFYQNATAFLCPSTSYFIGQCVVCTFGHLRFRGAHTSADLTLQRLDRFSSSIHVFKEWCEEDLGEGHGVRRRKPPRRLCITR